MVNFGRFNRGSEGISQQTEEQQKANQEAQAERAAQVQAQQEAQKTNLSKLGQRLERGAPVKQGEMMTVNGKQYKNITPDRSWQAEQARKAAKEAAAKQAATSLKTVKQNTAVYNGLTNSNQSTTQYDIADSVASIYSQAKSYGVSQYQGVTLFGSEAEAQAAIDSYLGTANKGLQSYYDSQPITILDSLGREQKVTKSQYEQMTKAQKSADKYSNYSLLPEEVANSGADWWINSNGLYEWTPVTAGDKAELAKENKQRKQLGMSQKTTLTAGAVWSDSFSNEWYSTGGGNRGKGESGVKLLSSSGAIKQTYDYSTINKAPVGSGDIKLANIKESSKSITGKVTILKPVETSEPGISSTGGISGKGENSVKIYSSNKEYLKTLPTEDTKTNPFAGNAPGWSVLTGSKEADKRAETLTQIKKYREQGAVQNLLGGVYASTLDMDTLNKSTSNTLSPIWNTAESAKNKWNTALANTELGFDSKGRVYIDKAGTQNEKAEARYNALSAQQSYQSNEALTALHDLGAETYTYIKEKPVTASIKLAEEVAILELTAGAGGLITKGAGRVAGGKAITLAEKLPWASSKLTSPSIPSIITSKASNLDEIAHAATMGIARNMEGTIVPLAAGGVATKELIYSPISSIYNNTNNQYTTTKAAHLAAWKEAFKIAPSLVIGGAGVKAGESAASKLIEAPRKFGKTYVPIENMVPSNVLSGAAKEAEFPAGTTIKQAIELPRTQNGTYEIWNVADVPMEHWAKDGNIVSDARPPKRAWKDTSGTYGAAHAQVLFSGIPKQSAKYEGPDISEAATTLKNKISDIIKSPSSGSSKSAQIISSISGTVETLGGAPFPRKATAAKIEISKPSRFPESITAHLQQNKGASIKTDKEFKSGLNMAQEYMMNPAHRGETKITPITEHKLPGGFAEEEFQIVPNTPITAKTKKPTAYTTYEGHVIEIKEYKTEKPSTTSYPASQKTALLKTSSPSEKLYTSYSPESRGYLSGSYSKTYRTAGVGPYSPLKQNYPENPVYLGKTSYSKKQNYPENPVYPGKTSYSKKQNYPENPVYSGKTLNYQKQKYPENPVYSGKTLYSQKQSYIENPLRPAKLPYSQKQTYPGKPIYPEKIAYDKQTYEGKPIPPIKIPYPDKNPYPDTQYYPSNPPRPQPQTPRIIIPQKITPSGSSTKKTLFQNEQNKKQYFEGPVQTSFKNSLKKHYVKDPMEFVIGKKRRR